jgi:hypothetical protein
MKALKSITIAILMLVALGSAIAAKAQTSKSEAKKTSQVVQIKNLVDSQNFVFVPQTLLPMRGLARHLTGEYYLRVAKDSVISYLPYFGRAYSAPLDPTHIDFDYTSIRFDYTKSENKKGGWTITIKPKDHTSVSQLILRIFENGSASLNINSDRDPISYQGYITSKRR